MFFFGNNKKKKQEKTPVWFMWLMGGFLIYALFTNLFTDNVKEVQEEQKVTYAQQQASNLNFAVVRGQSVGGPALPLYVNDRTRIPEGDMASCWYSVDVRYRMYNGDNKLVEEIGDKDEPLHFTIGRGEVIPGLERGIIGMRKGGEREITIRPELAYGHAGFQHKQLGKADFVGYILTLVDMQRPENLPFADLGLKIYNDTEGDGPVAQCTEQVRVKVKGYDTKGASLWKAGDVPAMLVNLGAGIAPYAVERGLLGMKVGGKRTLIVPPGYMKPLFADEDGNVLNVSVAGKGVEEKPQTDAAEEATPPAEQKAGGTKTDGQAIIDELRTTPKFTWQDMPFPKDETIILELELLPLELDILKTN